MLTNQQVQDLISAIDNGTPIREYLENNAPSVKAGTAWQQLKAAGVNPSVFSKATKNVNNSNIERDLNKIHNLVKEANFESTDALDTAISEMVAAHADL